MAEADPEVERVIREFLARSAFTARGAVVTDLDGTAVHEHEGRTVIPSAVELALARLHALGRPLVLNTLRFPLSVLRTFGREWYRIAGAPIPTITLNGSLLGRVVETPSGEMAFEELAATPLAPHEVEDLIARVERLLADGVRDVLLFWYPRDWREGELIWTPVPERVLPVKEKYASASSVTAVELPKLRAQLLSEDVCMALLLIDLPEDRLMAYQHWGRTSFVTRAGVDKLVGAQAMAERLGVSLADSIGAGDTPMDRFLAGVGLALHVGPIPVPWNGRLATLRLPDSPALGAALSRVAELHHPAASIR